MQHFSKQLRTRLLTLYLSAGLVMGWLPGCGSQDLEIADTVAESAVTATADATDVITFSQPEGPEESTVYVEPVDGISDDFYRGMDVSAVLALENSGVKYYNFDGEEQDVFMTLAQAGVNYIRLRVWNDPYDENGNGYGGGNNDVATAITLGQRATQYGMKVCIDFHYSDFWADPKKQFVPKAWEGMDIEEKSDALYNFTLENLTQILDAGVDVGMVQVGNEINNGMCGETDASNVRKLLASGSKAVRDAATASGKDILVAVHYTNIDDMKKLDTLLTGLQVKEIDYDIVGLSFYPYWHGTMDDLKNAIIHIRDTYGKKVYVAENAYCYTSEDGDGSANSIKGTDDLAEGYSASVQGQANEVRDVCAADPNFTAVALRYFNPIGAHMSGLLGENPNGIPNNLVPYVAQVASGKLDHVQVYGDDYDTPDGTGVRDYIHVMDLAVGHVAALAYGANHHGFEAVNLGTGHGSSVLEVIHAYEKACGRKIPVEITDRRAGAVAVSYADVSKAKELLGWEASADLQQMCSDSWRFTLQNPNGL